jgi:dolichol-phosphate mannosyltransferase
MIHKLKEENLDLIIASRFTPGAAEIYPPCGKCSAVGPNFFPSCFCLITSSGFECTAEILARFSKIGVKAAEYPLVLEYNLKTGKSKMRVARTIVGYFGLVRKVKNPLEPQGMKDNPV